MPFAPYIDCIAGKPAGTFVLDGIAAHLPPCFVATSEFNYHSGRGKLLLLVVTHTAERDDSVASRRPPSFKVVQGHHTNTPSSNLSPLRLRIMKLISLVLAATGPMGLHSLAARPLRVTVLGGTGYVGSAVCERLVKRGHTVGRHASTLSIRRFQTSASCLITLYSRGAGDRGVETRGEPQAGVERVVPGDSS